jgi:excisionase family DNA binding protein
MNSVYTTGQVARLCKVAPRTVTKWFDSGRLRGYRIPGSQDRRIPRANLIRFLKEHGMPLGELEEIALGKVLLVDANLQNRAVLGAYLHEDSFQIEQATNAFEAGLKARSMRPDCIVLDLSIGHDSGLQIARSIKHGPDNADAILIGLVGSNTLLPVESRALFDEIVPQPSDLGQLAERIGSLVQARKPLIA